MAHGAMRTPPEGGVPPNTRPRGNRIVRRLALVPLTIGVLLFPSAASALGLGEIEMQSALNERLDAEIPLRGVPEDEADRIIVSLASEEAFRQVGLQRPFALTRLQFAVRQHEDGRHYVHVTSREPIVEPFLSFLIEVDWPDGNLLREYTVLLDPPVFVSAREDEPAAAEPAEAPAAADEEALTAAGVPAEIERDAQAEEPAAAEPAPEAEPEAAVESDTVPEPETAPEPETVAGDFSDIPVFLQVEQEEERAQAEARREQEKLADAAAESAEGTGAADATATGYETTAAEYGPVRRGETLWNIAARLKRDDMTVQQMMLALLRYNPDAFVDDNINRLRQGYVLRVPDAEAVLSLSARQAVAQVREHNALWREFRTATRGEAAPAVETQADAAPTADEGVAGEGASLEIVGSREGSAAGTDESASATAGTDSGQDADLKLAREQLESVRMEKAELESRVTELEDTVNRMERLIEVREDQLARLQQQLQKIQQGEDVDESALAEMEDVEATATADDESVADEAAVEETTDTAAAGDAADDDAGGAAATTGGADGGDGGETTTGDADTQTAAAGGGDAAGSETRASADGADQGGSGVVTVRTQPAEPGWLDKAASFWNSVKATVGGVIAGAGLGALMANPLALPIAGGAAVLLLLGGLLVMRRRQAGVEEEVFDAGGQVAFAGGGIDEDDEFGAMLQSESDEGMAVEEEDAGFDEGDETAAFDTEEEDAESALMSEEFDLGDLEAEDREESTVAAPGSSEDETIAEADVYLAYGLHQQAEDLLKLALQEQPDRLDYHAKMLETLYGAGKSDAFIEGAEAFRAKVEDPNDRLWLQTVAMGKELAPDNPLFQQEVDEALKPADVAATRPPATDFEVGGDEEETAELDFSLDDSGYEGEGEEQDDDTFARTVMREAEGFEPKEGDAGLVGPGEKVEGPASSDEETVDFDLGDFPLDAEQDTVDETGGAMESALAKGSEADEDLEFDLGDLDMDEQQPGPSETSDESADSGEVEFDLGDLDMEEESAGEEGSVTPSAGEETAAGAMDTWEAQPPGETGTDEDEDVAATAGSGDESFDFDMTDLEESAGGATQEGKDTASDEAPLDLGDLDTSEDVSLADLESDLGGEESWTPAAPETEAGLADDEDDFDTMLDLARAYIDMGDAESARATLEEIAESGNEKQRSEAQSLLAGV